MKRVDNETLIFARESKEVKLPSRESHNAGYDVYAYFKEEEMIILPHETKMIPTGLYTAFSEDYVLVLKERGSTGTKGIAQRSGIVDSSYRGEIFVPLTNTTEKAIIITKGNIEELQKNENAQRLYTDAFGHSEPCKITYYPYTKAICQALLLPVPKVEIKEITVEELKAIPSERGEGKLGSSNK